MDVPGGIAAFARVLGADPDAPRARLMLTLVRLMWDVPAGVDAGADRRRADGLAYLETLAAFERAREAAAGEPIALATLVERIGAADAGVFAGALGCHLEDQGAGRWRLRPSEDPAVRRRAGWLSDAGVTVEAIVAGLNAGNTMALARPSDSVPLVLSRDAWARLLKPAQPYAGSLFTNLLSDRRGSFIYHGAAALDGPTRAFLEHYPPIVLYNEMRSPVFAQLGRGLRVAGDRVVVPGGADAEPLWEAVVGAPVTDATAFVGNLLEREGGRIALLYDALAHSSPEWRAFALGLGVTDTTVRLARFHALVQASSAMLAGWDPRMRPFERILFDVPHLVTRGRMAPDGRQPAGPWFRRFWDAVFLAREIPPPSATPSALEADEPADMAWLVERLGVPNTAIRRERAETWLFAQRVFPALSEAQVPDVFASLRGFIRFRTLVLTLERIGVTDPATYAQVVRAADRVSRAAGPRSWTTVAQFQGAVAVIERARFNRALDVAAADALLRSLAAVPILDGVEYLGGLAAWMDEQLLPVAGTATRDPLRVNPDRPVETRVLALMAGAVTSSIFGDPLKMPTMQWEGLLYRVDPAGSTLRRMIDVRARQDGPSLDAALTLARAVREAARVTVPQDVGARVGALSAAVADVLRLSVTDPGNLAAGAPDLARDAADVQRNLLALKGAPKPSDLASRVRPLARAADWYVARALAAVVYAPHLGEPDSPALLGGDPSPRHDFGLDDTRLDRRIEMMWRLPAEGRDRQRRWIVTGSMLGLDVALGRFALRRVPSEVMPAPPMLTDVERQAMTEAVILTSPFDATEEAREALLTALAAGRATLAAASPGTIRRLAVEAGLDEWRVEMLPWVRVHEPARVPELWSLGELVTLGLAGRPRPSGFDAWGGSDLSLDGRLACAFPWEQPWVTLSGRKGARLIPALVPDLGIALAESLAALGLPARLATGLLAVATQAFLDTVRTNHDDDWMTLVTHARKMVAGGIEDYVSALTIGGALVPADGEYHDANIR
jgi:hypothetical protein